MKKPGRIGMVFGVFDGLHEGHKHFLTVAGEQCDELYVAVADDAAVEALKGKRPRFIQKERMETLNAYDRSLNVIPGDAELGSWKTLRDIRPDIVFIGYDQEGIADQIKALNVPIQAVTSYEPARFKSSFLNGKGADNR